MPTLPPGPQTPSALQLLEWVFRPLDFMQRCAREYGDVFTFRGIRNRTMVFVSDPEMIREIFSGDPKVFHAGEANSIVKPIVGDRSVLLLDGAPHMRQRKLLLPPFHGDRMHAYGDVMRKMTRAETARWKPGQTFTLHPVFQRITLEVILRAVFGIRDDNPHLAELRNALEDVMHAGSKPYILLLIGSDGEVIAPRLHEVLGSKSPVTRFLQKRARVDALLFAELERRRSSGERGDDILSLLLDTRDEAGKPMSDAELRDALVTLLAAGHETSATTLSWVMSEVLRRPEVLARIRSELHEVAGDGPLETKQVTKLEYLDATIRETLRLRPILPLVVRKLKAPVKLGSLELPEGVHVCPCIYLAQRRKETWEDAENFRPERFLEKKPQPFEWFPFGGGARRCIGLAFAMFEMKVVLAEILGAHELRLQDRAPAKMARRGITFAPAGGVPVSVASN